jgi:RNA polymerase sigma factor (TIGR02999 family)
MVTSEGITGLLKAWGDGDRNALDRLTEILHGELRRIAHRYMRDEKSGSTLQTTALVNEVYLRLVDVKNVDWECRAQFFGIAAQVMRRILVDAARARGAAKRGAGAEKIPLNDALAISPEPDRFVLALDEALEELSKIAPRQARVVELRYFGGLTEEETAATMNSSPRTVRRDWQFAKAWLTREIRNSDRGESGRYRPQ